jgi:hypothetical protein
MPIVFLRTYFGLVWIGSGRTALANAATGLTAKPYSMLDIINMFSMAMPQRALLVSVSGVSHGVCANQCENTV